MHTPGQIAVRSHDHLCIPDVQAKPRVRLDHCVWAGNYIAKHRPGVIVCLGDLWDYPSVNVYDSATKKASAGANVRADFLAGKTALDLLMEPWCGIKNYKPKLIFTEGNHEFRIYKHLSEHPHLVGSVDRPMDYLVSRGWRVYPYQVVTKVDGVAYAHLFPRNANGIVTAHAVKYGAPSAYAQVRNNLCSATAGHKQGLEVSRPIKMGGKVLRGIIAGSFYQHDEGYLGPQGNNYWRGILHKHDVKNGDYRLEEISMKYLKENYA
jgi:hypothetical protein